MANLEPFAPLPSQDEKHQLAVVLTAMGTGFDKQQRGCETSVVARWLGQLTLEEKVDLLSGSDFCSTAGNSRLHIPSLKVCIKILSHNSFCEGSIRVEVGNTSTPALPPDL
jgi:hypothetical protein